MAVINFLVNLINNFIIIAYADLTGNLPPTGFFQSDVLPVIILSIPVLFILVPAIIFIILINRKKMIFFKGEIL